MKSGAVDRQDETSENGLFTHRGWGVIGARAAVVLTVVLTAGALTACGATPAGASAGSSDTPSASAGTSIGTPSGSPTSTGLGAVLAGIEPAQLPSTASAVASVLATLPGMLDGHRVTERTGKRVRYADGTALEAQPVEEAGMPGMTMAQFWPRLAAGHPGDFTVTSHSKPGEPVLWFTADGEGPYGAYVAVVASPTGSWLFAVDAPSEKAAKDLLTAFGAALV